MENHYLQLDGRLIGPGERCFIIAEAGVNHNGSLDMAMQLVDVAVQAGADAVKFQMRDLESLYPPALLANPNSAEWAYQYVLPHLIQSQLSETDYRQIKAYCDSQGIRFMCTPWDKNSLNLLESLEVRLYKVSSADLVNLPLLEQIVATGKPLILSTGMATRNEIERSVSALQDWGASFALLHCVSTYPAPFENLNLGFIQYLKQFGAPVGYSSHERGIAMPLVAVALGASIIEKHITLDRTLPGPDHAASLEQQGILKMIRDIRHAEQALSGKGEAGEKRLSSMEKLNRQVLRKSLAAVSDLPAGTIITHQMVKVQGPGKGLSPQRIHDLVGTVLKRDMKKDDYFTDNDLHHNHVETLQKDKLKRPWGFKTRFHDFEQILELKPRLVEFHFSQADLSHPIERPKKIYKQQLFIHAPEFADSKLVNLCSEDDELWERSIQLIQQTIDKTAEMRPYFCPPNDAPPGIVIHVGGMSLDEPAKNHDFLLGRAVQAFRQLDSKGLTLLPENLPPRPWYLGGQWYQNVFIRAEEMVEFCQELNLGLTLDISHAQLYCNATSYTLSDYIDRCLPYVRHLHLADASGIDGEGLQIGDGVVQWEIVLPLLKEHSFTWVPEIWSGHLESATGFIRAVNRLSAFGIL